MNNVLDLMVKYDIGVAPLLASTQEQMDGSKKVLYWTAAQRYLSTGGWQNLRCSERSANGPTPEEAVLALVVKLKARSKEPM